MSLRILTFNWHEAYIHLLAKTGHRFDVVQKRKAGIFGWIRALRPVPSNCRLVTEEEAGERLRSGAYDRIVAHNLWDVMAVQGATVPKVLVFHNKLSCEIALGGDPLDRLEYMEKVHRLLDAAGPVTLVFISPAKRADWGLAGEILPPGIDPADYGGYRGDLIRVLRVGNALQERDIMLGFSLQERILAGLPSTVLGLNRHLPGARVPRDWDAFRGFLREHRVYLNTTLEPYEDGYNLAMLEAMATGMPVVSAANRSSPLEDGANGFVSDDEQRLREGLVTLLADRERAAVMGRKAREAVIDRFPIDRFLRAWNRLLDAPPRCSPGRRTPRTPRRRVLLSYTSNPQTTGAYLEQALRGCADVITYGPAIDEGVLDAWDLHAVRDRVKPHDIPYFSGDLGRVLGTLPEGWMPDLLLWVESGVEYPLRFPKQLPFPTACYLVDTHLHLEKHLEVARSFTHVFVAQKRFVPAFRKAGLASVHWLPLACAPDTHGKVDVEKSLDVAFVGSVTAAHPVRNRLLLRLAERFPVHVDRCFLEEMAGTFSRAKIVFNRSVRDDLNMRTFEALATGSLLVTDEAPGSGLTGMFTDGKHLVIYRDERELMERVAHYLENEEERERIAARGRQEVLARHTYAHRARRLLETVFPWDLRRDVTSDAATERSGGLPEADGRFVADGDLDDLVGMIDGLTGTADLGRIIERVEAFLRCHPAHGEMLHRHAELCLEAGLESKAAESLQRLALFHPQRDGLAALRHRLDAAGNTG